MPKLFNHTTLISYNYIKMGISYMAKNNTATGVMDSGHYLAGENPDAVLQAVIPFPG